MKPLPDRDEEVLHSVAALARGAGPEALDDADAQRMIRNALLGSRLRGRRRRREAKIAAVAAAATLLAAVALLSLTTEGARPPAREREGASAGAAGPGGAAPEESADPMEFELPSGDQITAIEGSRFELVSVTDEDRRVSLTRGAMLFDVASLGDGSRFEVVTSDLRVRVLGTVFAVQASDEGTTVHVYEGRVQVLRGDDEQLLGAGESLSTGGHDEADPRLASRGLRAAATRTAAATAVAPTEVAPPATEAANDTASTGGVASVTARPTAAEARALIAAGDARGALALCRASLSAAPDDDAFRLVEADALRALRRFAEAAVAYDRVAASRSDERIGAGFRSASIRYRDLSDPAGALASLDAASVDSPGSPFEERGLALRARALSADGRADDARRVAERYLARFPTGTTRAFMERLVDPEAAGFRTSENP